MFFALGNNKLRSPRLFIARIARSLMNASAVARTAGILLALAVCGAQAQTTSGNAANGSTLFAAQCASCHGATPLAIYPSVANAANAGGQITYATANGMPAPALTQAQYDDIAAYIGNFVTNPNPANVAIPFNSVSGVGIAIPNIHLFSTYGDYTGLSTVTAPGKGTLTFAGNVVTYKPNTGQSGSDTFSVRADRADGGFSSTRTVTVLIAAPPTPVVTSAGTASGTGGQPFSYQITATNSPTSFGASGLPPGLTVNAATGLISGSPTASGTFNATVTASNGTTGNKAVTITIGLATPVITSAGTATGTGGQSFSYQITANNLPASFNATGLPPGVTVNTGSGLISGTPTASGVFNATISATNAATLPAGPTGSQALTITIGLATPVVTSAGVANATSGVPFTYQITASNLPASFNATGLPPGLSVDTTTGMISGTPVVGMTSTFMVTLSATNAAAVPTGTKILTLNISLNAPVINSATTASGTAGQPFSYQITATDFPTGYTATGLPPGLSINTTTGLISGTPLGPTAMTPVTITASNGAGTSPPQTLTISITLLVPVVTSQGAASAIVTQPFSYQITASNLPASYGAAGLPAGLGVNAATGLITGIPTAPGSFNVTVSASNASGTGTKTLAISIANFPAPTVASVTITVPHGSPASVPLLQLVTGTFTDVEIVTPPAHGSATLYNTLLTYTPTAGFFGNDSVAYRAVGPGGPSQAGLVRFIVGIPPKPAATARTVTVPFNTPTAIDLASSIAGVVTAVKVTAPPANGTAAVSGTVVTYTPRNGYFGADGFSYVADGPGGTSDPADVSIVVGSQAVTVAAVKFILPLNTPTAMDMAPFISGSGVSGVMVTAKPAHGVAAVNGTRITYSPNQDFFGEDSFMYAAFGNLGVSTAAVVTVSVVGRPDPSKDAAVGGIVSAQADAARRFAGTQIGNFHGRMESLHRMNETASGASTAKGVARDGDRDAVRMVSLDETTPNAPRKGMMKVVSDNSSALPARLVADAASLVATRTFDVARLAGESSAGVGMRESGWPINYWLAGAANFGVRGALDFSTNGLSFGADRRFSEKLALGAGLGFARDRTDIGGDGSRSRATGYSAVFYGSYQPSPGTFVDGLAGAGALDYKSRRYVTPIAAMAEGKRDGSQFFASLAGGWEYRDNGVLISPYGRIDYASTRLKEARETGAGQYALAYFAQTASSVQGALGLRAESIHRTDFGWAAPRLRAEYRREFQGERLATVAYADLVDGARYAISASGFARNTFVLGLGSDFQTRGGLTIGLDYELTHATQRDNSQGLRLTVKQDLDGRGAPLLLDSFPLTFAKPRSIQFDFGYMFDDNVTRAKDRRDKLSDRAYSANVGKGFVFTLSDHLRANVTYSLGGEKFTRYRGLNRAMAGVQGQLQYRRSGEFSAPTFTAFGEVTGDYFESVLRRGYRYVAGVSLRQSLTDRIAWFAALSHAERQGRSAVFDNRHHAFRLNVDYALTRDDTLYATGEYRRGQTFSTGHPSLENLDVAEVFVLDDAYPGGQLFTYRFDANTVISTLGYNMGFGPRHSLDFSWRRAQSTPRGKSSVFPASSYVADQYSVVYLIRF